MDQKKIICVIEARMGSMRFPGKSLLKLDKENTLIDYVIKNTLKSSYFFNSNTYVLTSNSKNNKPLIKYLKKKYSVKLIVGSENNVFSRYLKFKNQANFPILRLTGDNPLIDPILIDRFIKTFLKKKIDYITTRGMTHSKNWKVKSSFPKGISLEAFNSKIFFSKEKQFNQYNQEFPTWFFFNKKINAKIRKFNSFGNYKNLNQLSSFTLDEKKDYNRLRKFIKMNKCKPGLNNIWNIYGKNKN